jgi:hypothetical protein
MNMLEEGKRTMPQQSVSTDEVNRARRKLCNAIRDGLFDERGERQQMLLATLTQIAHGKLAISNPKALRP